jgi:RNA polymerase sigma factor (sigma-70 family)
MEAKSYEQHQLVYRREPLLTAAEEIELSRLIQAGMAPNATQLEQRRGIRAKQRMIRANMRWVIALAHALMRNYRPVSLTLDDLIQEGAIGLNRAAELFDHTRGYKFSTYSHAWIKQSLRRAIGYQDRIIRLPVNIQEEMYRFKRTNEVHGASMSTDELLEAANVSRKSFELAAVSNTVVSSNVRAKNHERSEIGELLIAETEPSYLEEMGWDGDTINQLLLVLEHRERQVICWLYGLNGQQVHFMPAVAMKLGVSRERVAQLRDRAHRKLRNHVHKMNQK